jgi:hypothetical protein
VAAYPPYPTALETIDAARDLAGQVRAGFASRPLAAKAAYTVIGFGLGQLVGEPSEGFGGHDHGIMTAFDIDDATAAMELDNLAANLAAPDGVSGPISGLVSAALIRWATKLAWRLLIG